MDTLFSEVAQEKLQNLREYRTLELAVKEKAWEKGIQACKSAAEKNSFDKLWLSNRSGVLVEYSKDEFLKQTLA